MKRERYEPYMSQLKEAGVSPKYFNALYAKYSSAPGVESGDDIVEEIKKFITSAEKGGREGGGIVLFSPHDPNDFTGLLSACMIKSFMGRGFSAKLINLLTLTNAMMSREEDQYGYSVFDAIMKIDFLLIDRVTSHAINKGVVSTFNKVILARNQNKLITSFNTHLSEMDLTSEENFGPSTSGVISRDFIIQSLESGTEKL